MRVSDSDLQAATTAGLISAEQLPSLLAFLKTRQQGAPASGSRFDLVHVLWYAGALIVIGAMGLFSTLAFAQMGGQALTVTALAYAAVFGWAGHYLWTVKALRTPGGLLIAIAVSMAPLAVYGVQDALDLWGEFGKPGTVHEFYTVIKGSWLFMEIAAIAAAVLALRFYRFPFLVVIVAVALWFMSMDIVSWITDLEISRFELARRVSIAFGFGLIAVAVIVNGRQRRGDFAFWLYLFGVLTFWGAITAASDGTALGKAIYCAMNVGFLFIAVFLGRRVFAVFGIIGIAIYLGDLAGKVFKDSLLFPFALSLIGVGIIALGLYYYRHQDAVRQWADERLPGSLRRLRAGYDRQATRSAPVTTSG